MQMPALTVRAGVPHSQMCPSPAGRPPGPHGPHLHWLGPQLMSVDCYIFRNFGSLQSATVGIFTPWKPASPTIWGFFSCWLFNIYEHPTAPTILSTCSGGHWNLLKLLGHPQPSWARE